jgi:arylsulfatase A-like enzyme
MYGTDNGPHMNTLQDGAMTPFRGEKTTNWEGGFRTPAFVRWPGKIEAGTISNEIMSNLDWAPTLVAAAGEPKVKEKLLTDYKAAGKDFKIHLDATTSYRISPARRRKGRVRSSFTSPMMVT